MPVPSAPRYRVGNIEIDPTERCIWRNGQPENPRARVLDLLLYLIQNRDRLITKQELVEQVWENIAVSDSVLYKTILEVRRLLGDDPDNPLYVKTLPKAGYRFIGVVETEIPVAPEPLPLVEPTPPHPAARSWKLATAAAAACVSVLVATGIFVFVRQPNPSPAPDEEVAWWQFDERTGFRAHDKIGRSHGSLLAGPNGGTPPRWTSGRSGGGVSLNGGNYIEGEIRIPAWSAVTFSAWVRSQQTAAERMPIFDWWRVRVEILPNLVLMGRASDFAAVRGPVDDGKWHHIVAVDEGPLTNSGSVYLDGAAEEPRRLPAIADGADHRWRLGRYLAGKGFFNGLIDDVRIYARPLRKLEVEAIYRCSKETADLTTPAGKQFYYLPVFEFGAFIEADGSITNKSKDLGGVQLAERGGDCGVSSLRGADLGQDLRIALDLRLTRDAAGHITGGGPYLRSRGAYPGDGIVGGTSSGYWLRLDSAGEVRLMQLRPYLTLATSASQPDFEVERFHHIELVARGNSLYALLDGRRLVFQLDGHAVDDVPIEQTGPGRGTAGVAFVPDANRGYLGGQQVRNLAIERLGN